jgi:hypothetical protein
LLQNSSFTHYQLPVTKMEIQFREFNPFDTWIWLKFSNVPSQREKQYVEEVFNSWFYLGKLGGFNAENLQIQDTGLDISYMDYDARGYDKSLMALMHNMGEFEYEGEWAIAQEFISPYELPEYRKYDLNEEVKN